MAAAGLAACRPLGFAGRASTGCPVPGARLGRGRRPALACTAAVADVQEAPTDVSLDADLRGLAAAACPRPQEKAQRHRLLQTIEAAARGALGRDVRVFAFGGCVDGCGEGGEEMDAVLYVPVTASRAAGSAFGSRRLAGRCLREVAAACRERGLYLGNARKRRGSSTIRLEEHARVQAGDRWQTCLLRACELHCQELLPLLSSRLLRGYAELEGHVRTLAIAVKRWSQAAGISGATHDGFLSPFAWTLLVIYYLQVRHGLPSLHALAPGRPAGPGRWPSQPGYCDVAFASAAEADRQLEPSVEGGREALSAAVLFRGFFAFFGYAFDWDAEVASVRLGRRSDLGSRHFAALRASASGRAVGINIENPIAVSRNLNSPLNDTRACEMREAFRRADARLAAGEGLGELLAAPGGELPCLELAGGLGLQEGFLRLPDFVDDTSPCVCDVCGRRFEGRLLLMQHQVDRGHLNSDSAAELERLRTGDAAAVAEAADRLRAALSGG
uniref:C2H2-type domain-containing protein n=1 Tax=Alexandrium monilatum TaxID=311494 RepID=A0A7S4T667_9DINO